MITRKTVLIFALVPILFTSCSAKSEKVDLSKENWTRYTSISFGSVSIVDKRPICMGTLTLDKDYVVAKQGFIDGWVEIHCFWYWKDLGTRSDLDVRFYFSEYIKGNVTRLECYGGFQNVSDEWYSTKVNSVSIYSIKGIIEKK